MPERLQKAMAAEAEAAREARAKVGPCRHYPEKTTFASVSTFLRVPGDRGGGRAQGEQGAEARCGHHHGESRGAAAAIPPDTRTHRGREQLHHHLPCISTHYL